MNVFFFVPPALLMVLAEIFLLTYYPFSFFITSPIVCNNRGKKSTDFLDSFVSHVSKRGGFRKLCEMNLFVVLVLF